MLTKVKIALQIPHPDRTDRFFLLSLKQGLYNEPSEYRTPKKVLVVSDIGGDFRAFCKILLKSKVINKYLQWIFEEGHLVIVGNCFNEGKQSIECLWFIYALEEKAREKGGYVHFILGDTEITNLNGIWRYKHPKYAERNVASNLPVTALYDANSELWRWLYTKNMLEKVGDVLFVHGGVAVEILYLGLSVSDLNNLVRQHYIDAKETFNDPALQMIFNSEKSPLRYQGYYKNDLPEDKIDAVLDYFRVKNIVTGHTIVDKVSAFYSGKVINVRTNCAKGQLEALLIKGHRFYRIDLDGQRERIYL